MKRIGLTIVLFTVGGLMVGPGFAADGQIDITGLITDTTCPITGSTSAAPGTSANFPVKLPSVQASALKASGDTAAYTPFFIHIGGGTNCSAPSVAVLFERNSPMINPATGNLQISTAGSPATNIEVQIVDVSANAPIDLRLAANSTGVALTAGTVATLPFAAQYIAAGGAAGPGTVVTSVQYTVTFP